MVSLTVIKIIAIAVMLAEALVGGWLPVLVKRLREPGRVLVAAQGFSGGVMTAIATMDLLPDALEEQRGAVGEGKYPFWAIFVLLGFLLVLAMEKVVSATDDEAEAARQLEKQGASKLGLIAKLRKSLVAAFALSVHSVLEGLALGIQSDVDVAEDLFIAIASHKLVAALALGVKVGKEAERPIIAGVTTVFAIMTPIGIAIGIGLVNIDPWVTLVLQCLASGTFLYVGAFEGLHLLESSQASAGTTSDEPDVEKAARPADSFALALLPYGFFLFGAVVIGVSLLGH